MIGLGREEDDTTEEDVAAQTTETKLGAEESGDKVGGGVLEGEDGGGKLLLGTHKDLEAVEVEGGKEGTLAIAEGEETTVEVDEGFEDGGEVVEGVMGHWDLLRHDGHDGSGDGGGS